MKPDRETVRKVLAPFYKTVDVMKSARNSPSHVMHIWADDMKAVEDVMLFLEALRDSAETSCDLVPVIPSGLVPCPNSASGFRLGPA